MSSSATNLAPSAPARAVSQFPRPLDSRRAALAALLCLCAAFLGAFLTAHTIKRLTARPDYARAAAAVSEAILDPKHKAAGEVGAAALAILIGLLAPRALAKRTARLRRAVGAFARHKRLAAVFVALLPMVVRLGLLPVLGIPEPLIADEFGYLLIADTFAAGRLANPPHPFWPHFETIYTFHQPSYASIYPVAPALALVIPKLLGVTPWLGVWLGAGAMCGLVCWMLQGWVRPQWALVAGLIVAGRFAVVGPWMNTYWGGAAGVAAGALLLGALPRMMKQPRVSYALLFGSGLAALAHTRPYEGFLFSLPVVLMAGVWLVRSRETPWHLRLRNVVLPLAAGAVLLAGGTAYYNYRLTGHPLLMPYGLHQKLYGTPQSFYWQAPIRDAPGIHRHRDIAQVFHWQLAQYESQFSWRSQAGRLRVFWDFYLQPLLTVPLLLLPVVLRDRRLLAASAAAVLVMAGNSFYPFFFPHYAAPLCGLLLLLVVHGLRRLRAIRFGAAPVGQAICAGLLLAVGASAALTTLGGLLQPAHVSATRTPRAQALEQLSRLGGEHLVLVRYTPEHSFHYGVVFNDADIELAPVVWARELDEASTARLIEHFAGRRVWWFNPDESPATLTPYTTKPYLTVVANGAGRRDDTREGVSPGSIAILFGGNFARHIYGSTAVDLLGAVPFQVASAGVTFGNVFVRPAAAPPSAEREAGGFDASTLSVRFGGREAAVLGAANFAWRESVTVRVPENLRAGWTTVELRVGGKTARSGIRILPATPGIFQMRMKDSRVRAIVLRDDGALVDLDHPARRGESLRLLATGLGPLTRRGAVRTEYPLIAGVNHRGAPLLSATPAPDAPGVVHVRIRIPEDAPRGADVPLSLAVIVDGKPVYSNKSSLPVK